MILGFFLAAGLSFVIAGIAGGAVAALVLAVRGAAVPPAHAWVAASALVGVVVGPNVAIAVFLGIAVTEVSPGGFWLPPVCWGATALAGAAGPWFVSALRAPDPGRRGVPHPLRST